MSTAVNKKAYINLRQKADMGLVIVVLAYALMVEESTKGLR